MCLKLLLFMSSDIVMLTIDFQFFQSINYKIFYCNTQMGNCTDLTQSMDSPVLGRLGPVSELRMINTLWLKDYQGLFDYQSKDIKQVLLRVPNSCILMQNGQHKVYQQHPRNTLSQAALKKSLFQIVKRSNFYKIMPIYIESQQQTVQKLLWLVIKSVPNHKYPLRQKDILKFGKQKIKVREIVLPDTNPSAVYDTHIIKTNKKIYDDIAPHENVKPQNGKEDIVQEVVSIATQNEQTCRICLEPGELNNPLICACKCTGSVRYIHLQCLRTWLGKQLNVSKTKYCVTIKWTPLQCQMCKTHYKYRIYLDNNKYYTVEIPKPAKPYIVLQIMKKSAQFSKILHFVSLSQTSKLSIGRKKDIDIKLSEDISISRHHANLLYDFESKQFLIEDNHSKFGTLVLVKKNVIVSPKTRGLSFQIEGEIFTFETHRLQGSIPDYYDEDRYLNVVERESVEKVEEQQSDQNNDEEDDYDEEIEQPVNVSQNASHAVVANHPHPEQNPPNLVHQVVSDQRIQQGNQLRVESSLNRQPNNELHVQSAANRQVQSLPQIRNTQPQIQNLDV